MRLTPVVTPFNHKRHKSGQLENVCSVAVLIKELK